MSRFKFTVMSLPIVLLAAVLVILNAFNTSAQEIIDHKILPQISDRERLIGLDKRGVMNIAGQKMDSSPFFTDKEIASFKKMGTIESVTPVRPGDGLFTQTDQLINGQSVFIEQINGVSPQVAKQLGATDFQFDERTPIPIILGRSSIKRWRDIVTKSDTARPEQLQSMLDAFNRNHSFSEAMDDDSALRSLVGKTFTASIGQLPPTPILYSTPTLSGSTFQFIPVETRKRMANDIKNEIGKYWDYNMLSQGTPARFRVVGLDFSLDQGAAVVPYDAVAYLLQQLYRHTMSAQKSSTNPSLLGGQFVGLQQKDDGFLWADSNYIQGLTLQDKAQVADKIFIPGLIYGAKGGNVTVLQNFQVKAEDLPDAKVNLSVRNITDVLNTSNALTMKGYAGISAGINYQSVAGFAHDLKSLSQMIINLLTIIAVVITGFLMLRIVKQSQYEIGIIQALGATKVDVLLKIFGLFGWQLLLSLVVGALVGLAVIFSGAGIVANEATQADVFGLQNIMLNYGTQITLSASDLQHINVLPLVQQLAWIVVFSSVGLLLALLLAVRVSPIESIRRE